MRLVITDIELRGINMLNQLLSNVDKSRNPDIYEYLLAEIVFLEQIKYVLERYDADDLESLAEITLQPDMLNSAIMFLIQGKDYATRFIDSEERLIDVHESFAEAITLLKEF